MPATRHNSEEADESDAMIRFDQLEENINDIATSAGGSQSNTSLDAQLAVLDELYEQSVQGTTNTTLIQRDANVFYAFVNAKNAQSNPVASTFLNVLDEPQLHKSLMRLKELNGLEKVLDDEIINYGGFEFKPATCPRGFDDAEIKERAPREKKTREVGPAKQTVAFDQEKQQNDEARAIRAIKIHLKNRYLEEGMPLNYYQFVLNRSSFTQTVENIFYLSFLVRDYFVEVIKSDDPLGTKIRPLFRRPGQVSTEDSQEGGETDPYVVEGCDEKDYVVHTSGTRKLFLAEMDHKFWTELCHEFSDGGIPSRGTSDENQYERGPQLLSPPLS